MRHAGAMYPPVYLTGVVYLVLPGFGDHKTGVAWSSLFLIPLALRGVKFRAESAVGLLRRNLLI